LKAFTLSHVGHNCSPVGFFATIPHDQADNAVHEYIHAAAHFVIKEVHDRDISAPEVRPKSEILNDTEEAADSVEDESFSQEEIVQTTRLARDHAFGHFDSGRASNALVRGHAIFRVTDIHGMVRCGATQELLAFSTGVARTTAHMAIPTFALSKQFDPDELVDGFYETTDRLLSVIASESSFRRPVIAAIDITTIPYYGDVEEMSMVSGTKDRDGRAFKFATLSIIGQNIPLILAVEPVRESSEWDENPSNQIHRTVRRLVRRAKEHVPIETVLCDREFDSIQVFQTLSNLDVNYLIPKRVSSSERDVLEQMEEMIRALMDR